MQMKVNIAMIREARLKRGWSQEQLAMVAGLGLRTVHRVENEGTTSLESAMALASALELGVEDLRESTTQPLTTVSHRVRTIDLLLRLMLAVVSGAFVSYLLDPSPNNLIRQAFGTFTFLRGLDYEEPLCGLIFGLFVLYPFTARNNRSKSRSLLLILSGYVSFMAAGYLPDWIIDYEVYGDSIAGYLLASVVGGTIVLVSARLLLKLVMPFLVWIAALISCLLGGAYLYLVVKVLSDYELTTFASMTGFALWHGLMVLLLFYSNNRQGAGGDTVLAPVVRWVDERVGEKIEGFIRLGEKIFRAMPDSRFARWEACSRW